MIPLVETTPVVPRSAHVLFSTFLADLAVPTVMKTVPSPRIPNHGVSKRIGAPVPHGRDKVDDSARVPPRARGTNPPQPL